MLFGLLQLSITLVVLSTVSSVALRPPAESPSSAAHYRVTRSRISNPTGIKGGRRTRPRKHLRPRRRVDSNSLPYFKEYDLRDMQTPSLPPASTKISAHIPGEELSSSTLYRMASYEPAALSHSSDAKHIKSARHNFMPFYIPGQEYTNILAKSPAQNRRQDIQELYQNSDNNFNALRKYEGSSNQEQLPASVRENELLTEHRPGVLQNFYDNSKHTGNYAALHKYEEEEEVLPPVYVPTNSHARPTANSKVTKTHVPKPTIEDFVAKQEEELQMYRQRREREEEIRNKGKPYLHENARIHYNPQEDYEYPVVSAEAVSITPHGNVEVPKERPATRKIQRLTKHGRPIIELEPVYSENYSPESVSEFRESFYSQSPHYSFDDSRNIPEEGTPFSFHPNEVNKPTLNTEKEKRQAHHPYGYDHNGAKFAAAASAAEHAHGQAGDGRLTFQLHGQKGPHSYRFGFDTGKGPHRQFRYEERTNDGTVKGRFGYYDSNGKLQVYNYSAHPHHGYAAAEAH